jgi:hypothetical protein
MRQLGGPAAVKKALRENYPDLLTDLELVEYIPSGGRTYRNKASAQDYSRFLLALWKDELPGAAEIKRLMGLPKRDRLSTGVPLPEGTEVYSKTGSTGHLCGDMGVLLAKGPDGKQYAYSVIGLIEKQRRARHYMRWLRSRGNVIREISGMVSRMLGKVHGFASAQKTAVASASIVPQSEGYQGVHYAYNSPDALSVSRALIEEFAPKSRAIPFACEESSMRDARLSEAAAAQPIGMCSGSSEGAGPSSSLQATPASEP